MEPKTIRITLRELEQPIFEAGKNQVLLLG